MMITVRFGPSISEMVLWWLESLPTRDLDLQAARTVIGCPSETDQLFARLAYDAQLQPGDDGRTTRKRLREARESAKRARRIDRPSWAATEAAKEHLELAVAPNLRVVLQFIDEQLQPPDSIVLKRHIRALFEESYAEGVRQVIAAVVAAQCSEPAANTSKGSIILPWPVWSRLGPAPGHRSWKPSRGSVPADRSARHPAVLTHRWEGVSSPETGASGPSRSAADPAERLRALLSWVLSRSLGRWGTWKRVVQTSSQPSPEQRQGPFLWHASPQGWDLLPAKSWRDLFLGRERLRGPLG